MSVDLTPWLFAGGFAAAGAGLLIYTVRGLRRGRVTPMIRGYRSDPYQRRTEPKRFWLSFGYNLILAIGMLLGGTSLAFATLLEIREQPFREACLSQRLDRTPHDVIAACKRWVANSNPRGFDLGLARATEAEAHAVLGEKAEATLMRRAAIGAYGHSLTGYPADSAAHWNIAMLMLAEGDLPQARLALQAYVELEPDRGDGWLELGLVELALNQTPGAITHLTRAIERLPGEARPLAARGIAFGFARDRDRAAADINAARKIDPADPLVKEADRVFAADPLPALTSRRPR